MITVAWISEVRFEKGSFSRLASDFLLVKRLSLEDFSFSSICLEELQIVNKERPVLDTGRPNKSNRSCNRGFFTSQSTSQSLFNDGFKFTCDLIYIIKLQFNYIILFQLFYILYSFYIPNLNWPLRAMVSNYRRSARQNRKIRNSLKI